MEMEINEEVEEVINEVGEEALLLGNGQAEEEQGEKMDEEEVLDTKEEEEVVEGPQLEETSEVVENKVEIERKLVSNCRFVYNLFLKLCFFLKLGCRS